MPSLPDIPACVRVEGLSLPRQKKEEAQQKKLEKDTLDLHGTPRDDSKILLQTQAVPRSVPVVDAAGKTLMLRG